MTSNEVYAARRKALRITRQEVADRANCTVDDVTNFENQIYVSHDTFEAIKNAIWTMSKELDEVDHYRVKILEEAIKIRDEQNKDYMLQDIAHLMIELGKLQGFLMGYRKK